MTLEFQSPEARGEARRRFNESLEGRVAELRGLLDRADAGGDAEALTELQAAMRRLATAADVTGFESCGELAKRGDRLLEDALAHAAPVVPSDLPEILGEIAKSITRETGQLLVSIAVAEPNGKEGSIELASQPRRGRACIVAESRTATVDAIERELTATCFSPKWVKPEGCASACRGAAAVLVDVQAGGDGYALCAQLARMPFGPKLRVLYSERDVGFDVLRMVSSSAQRLIHRPFELRTVLRPENSEVQVCQAKIMAVEASSVDGEFIATALGTAGHTVQVVSNPLNLLEAMGRFRPDLLLLEWDLPNVNGGDLARIVRSDSRNEVLPIVFLTNRSGRDERRAAARGGADDFLTKPLTGPELVESLEIRLKRNWILRRRLDADGLTDLLNRTAAVSAVDDLLQVAERKCQFVLVGIIDIDHFKRVNDDLGHPTGDRVLRELATHVRASLGPGDVAGRLGGEELLVAFIGTDPDRLLTILDKLRESLRIELRANDGGFLRRVTFSAGAAVFPSQATQTADLLKQADLALYEAKSSGRNRVVLAHPAASK